MLKHTNILHCWQPEQPLDRCNLAPSPDFLSELRNPDSDTAKHGGALRDTKPALRSTCEMHKQIKRSTKYLAPVKFLSFKKDYC